MYDPTAGDPGADPYEEYMRRRYGKLWDAASAPGGATAAPRAAPAGPGAPTTAPPPAPGAPPSRPVTFPSPPGQPPPPATPPGTPTYTGAHGPNDDQRSPGGARPPGTDPGPANAGGMPAPVHGMKDPQTTPEGEADYYHHLGQEFAGLRDDPRIKARGEHLSELYDQEVNSAGYQAGRAAAGAAGRRGMSRSGYATSTQQNVWAMAAAERARGRESTMQQAITEGERAILGEAQIHGMGTSEVNMLSQQAFQRQMLERQLEAQQEAMFWEGIMQMGGTLGGAAIGKKWG